MNETTATTATTKPGSALAALKALSAKKPAPAGSLAAEQAADPALAGAKRNKSTVTLGVDPAISEDAATCARLRAALDDAAASFAEFQVKIRDYGRAKRERYNELYKAQVTTVEVPYLDGQEKRVVQVICSNKYSINSDAKNLRPLLGERYDLLFREDQTKTLRPNAEDLFQSILQENGIVGEDLERAMSVLFEETSTVTVRADFEEQKKKLLAAESNAVDQFVTRAQPGLKFPGV